MTLALCSPGLISNQCHRSEMLCILIQVPGAYPVKSICDSKIIYHEKCILFLIDLKTNKRFIYFSIRVLKEDKLKIVTNLAVKKKNTVFKVSHETILVSYHSLMYTCKLALKWSLIWCSIGETLLATECLVCWNSRFLAQHRGRRKSLKWFLLSRWGKEALSDLNLW